MRVLGVVAITLALVLSACSGSGEVPTADLGCGGEDGGSGSAADSYANPSAGY